MPRRRESLGEQLEDRFFEVYGKIAGVRDEVSALFVELLRLNREVEGLKAALKAPPAAARKSGRRKSRPRRKTRRG